MSKDVIRANRSGKVPGAITALASLVFIGYDEQHWHLMYHMLGRNSGIASIAFIIILVTLVTVLFRRKTGQVSVMRTEIRKENE